MEPIHSPTNLAAKMAKIKSSKRSRFSGRAAITETTYFWGSSPRYKSMLLGTECSDDLENVLNRRHSCYVGTVECRGLNSYYDAPLYTFREECRGCIENR